MGWNTERFQQVQSWHGGKENDFKIWVFFFHILFAKASIRVK